MFRSWQNNLQNLNRIHEVVTFINELLVQRQHFKNELKNKVKYLKNLNAVNEKEDATFVKNLQKLKQSNAETSKWLEVCHGNVNFINIIKQNNEAMAQINQKLARNANCIKQNLKEVDFLNKFYKEINGKRQQIFLHAVRIEINLEQQQNTNIRNN